MLQKVLSEKDLYEIIANSSSDYLSVADINYRYLAVNKAYCKVFNLSYDAIIGKTSEELLGKEHFQKNIKPNFDRCLKEDLTINYEDWFDLPTGRRFFSVSYTPIQTDSYERVVVVTVHDNTRHRLLEESFEKAIAELKEANSFKDKLFSMVSHDIKSPIASIDGFFDLIGNNETDFNQLRGLIPTMSSKLKNTRSMLDNLLNWAATQMKGRQISRERFCVKKAVDETLELYEDKIKEKSLFIDNRLVEDTYVLADKDAVRLIFRNLITNSIKFSFPEGTIKIHQLEQKEDDFLQFGVEDQGSGMSKEKTSQLFTNIVSSEKGTQGEKGTGLGMMLVGDSISLHGGKIWAESEENVGSKFFFTLPEG